jgi:hypothetical protein
VLIYIGSFPITAGALEQGFVRGLNLVGLVYLSRYAVSPGLPIPGRAGALLYRVFFYFEELTAYRVVRDRSAGFRKNIKRALIGIDEFLLQLAAGGAFGETAAGPAGRAGSSSAGPRGPLMVPLAAAALQWGLYAAVRVPALVSLIGW